MSDIPSIVIRAAILIINSVMGIFEMLHWAERHQSQSSRVGDSGLDREARRWQEWVLDCWHWLALALIAIAALIGGAIRWL